MRDAENIRALEQEVKPDMMGFIFWEQSPRHVSDRPAYLPQCPRVGVFVNPALAYVQKCTDDISLSAIQLHGQETPSFCQQVRAATGCTVIKAISVASAEDIAQSEQYQDSADLLLFDTKCPSVGGSGLQFDWDVLHAYRGRLPFLLSGGIGPDDAERVLAWHHPKCIGIDINSRFEVTPAFKDIAAIDKFTKHIRQ